MKPNNMNDRMSRRVFNESLKSDDFLTIDQIVQRLEDANYFDESAVDDAVYAYKKAVARKMMRQEKDSRGRPKYANIEIQNADGESVHGYMQQELFDVSHYKQVIDFHVSRAKHHLNEASEYAKDLKARHNEQIELPFSLSDEKLKAA